MDWRFLLPETASRRVGFLEPVAADEWRVLGDAGAERVDASRTSTDLGVLVISGDVDPSRLPDHRWVLVRLHRRWLRAPWGPTSRAGWVRDLEKSGHDVIRTYWHAPNRERCSYIVPLGDRVAVSAMLRRHQGVRWGFLKSLVARAVNRLGLNGWVARDLTLVAGRKTATGASEPAFPGLPRLSTAPAARLLVTPWEEASRHVVCLYIDPGTRTMTGVAKLPRRPGDVSGISREAAVLTEVAGRTDALRDRIPRVVQLSTDGARSFLLETAVPGELVGPEAVRARGERLVEAGLEFVGRLPVSGSTDAEPSWFTRLVENPLEGVAQRVDLPTARDLVDRTIERLHPLRTASLPLVFEHGDLGHPNLLYDGRHLGAVDWERAEAQGLPCGDLVFFLQYVSEARLSTFERAGQLQAFDLAFTGPEAWATPWFRRYAKKLGVDRDLVPCLVLATWARCAAGLLRRLEPEPGREPTTSLTTTFVSDRDYALWLHALERFDRLAC